MRGEHYLALVVLAGALSVGCGGGGGSHQDVPAGQLIVTPASLNFGNVVVGQQATKTGTLKAGNAGIAVTSADWKGDGYSVSGISFPITIAAGQSVSYKVTFAPQRSGSSSGNINFVSDASNSPHTEAFQATGTQASEHTVTLSWHPSKANAVAYNIYRGLKSQGPFVKLNSDPHPNSTFTDASVESGQTYYYVTTALNKHGKESKYSNRVQVTIPNS